MCKHMKIEKMLEQTQNIWFAYKNLFCSTQIHVNKVIAYFLSYCHGSEYGATLYKLY